MKNLILITMAIAGLSTAKLMAQTPNIHQEKMQIFSAWSGHWHGVGSIVMGPGEPKKSIVDESIEYKLDGTVLLVEGIGKQAQVANDSIVVHHALAILSWDDHTKAYKFKTYLKDGKSAEAWFKVTGANEYVWGFDSPQRKIRYNISIDAGNRKWKEVGEYSVDGTTWTKFFEMNLTKR